MAYIEEAIHLTKTTQETGVQSGLAGVLAAATEISLVDGERGQLVYRGHWAQDLAVEYTFEHVAHLLWFGSLPCDASLIELRQLMAQYRILPEHVKTLIESIPAEADMMSVIRTCLSSLAGADFAWPPTPQQAVQLTAVVPTIIAWRHRKLARLAPIDPRADLSHTANYLYMLNGKEPTSAHVAALDAYLILTSEHGMNASTFAGRVTISTRSDLVSAVTSAVGAMKGPLHGGAPSEVDDTLAAIGTKENAEPFLRDMLSKGERIMGFGHRVYKTRDPRAVALSEVARRVAGEDSWLDLATHVEDVAVRLLAEYKPGRNLYANVEFYAAAVLRAVELPPELYTPTFTVARMAGWTAHALEQATEDRLIRPGSKYVGSMPEQQADTAGTAS